MEYTDEEIITMLEICTNSTGCINCPLADKTCMELPVHELDLIKRQREEIEKRQWISVEDRLPEKDSRVLVYFRSAKNEGIEDCYFSGMRNRFVLYHTFEEIPDGITITHWMPMPEPPKGRRA